MRTADYLNGVRDTLESLIYSCDLALAQAEVLGLKEDDAVVSYNGLKDIFKCLLEQQMEDITND